MDKEGLSRRFPRRTASTMVTHTDVLPTDRQSVKRYNSLPAESRSGCRIGSRRVGPTGRVLARPSS